MSAVRVAFDAGPLAGVRTGVGQAVAAMRDALGRRDDIRLDEYVLSSRAELTSGERRLPLPAALAHRLGRGTRPPPGRPAGPRPGRRPPPHPAALAHRLWRYTDHPRVDRWVPDVDVVHGTNYVVPPSRRPRLVSVYDCWFLRHPESAHPDVRRAGHVLRRAVAGGAAVHTSSQATADALGELLPGTDVTVVPLGPLPVLSAPAGSPIPEIDGRPYVLAIGTLERRKNLPRLVEAFGRVAAEQPDLVLVLAGADGDDRSEIDAAIDAIGAALADRVLLTGRVDAPTRAWLLHHAWVLAYPSLDEGFGFPLLDAMQLHVPVVASDAG